MENILEEVKIEPEREQGDKREPNREHDAKRVPEREQDEEQGCNIPQDAALYNIFLYVIPFCLVIVITSDKIFCYYILLLST